MTLVVLYPDGRSYASQDVGSPDDVLRVFSCLRDFVDSDATWFIEEAK